MSKSAPSDMLVGVEQISDHIEKEKRETYYLCEKRRIPAFKLGNKWHMRPSTYAAFIAEREAEVLQSARGVDDQAEHRTDRAKTPARR
jgi:hypothetical protein